MKTTFPQNFVVDEWPTTSFPTCVTCHEQLRTPKPVLVFVLVLEAKALWWYNGQFLFSSAFGRLRAKHSIHGPISDKVLLGHMIRRELVSDEGHCRVNCYMEPSCVSIAVGPMNQVTKTCDLNNATVDGSPGSTLKQKIGYLHLAVEVRFN